MTPSRTAMIVGMERMSNFAASACWSSVSTLPNVMSWCFSEERSYVGAKRTQGPHQLAQKSTRTIPSLAVSSSKFSAVKATVAMMSPSREIWLACRVTHRSHLPFPPRVPQHIDGRVDLERGVGLRQLIVTIRTESALGLGTTCNVRFG